MPHVFEHAKVQTEEEIAQWERQTQHDRMIECRKYNNTIVWIQHGEPVISDYIFTKNDSRIRIVPTDDRLAAAGGAKPSANVR
jgi:hypothetical protein